MYYASIDYLCIQGVMTRRNNLLLNILTYIKFSLHLLFAHLLHNALEYADLWSRVKL